MWINLVWGISIPPAHDGLIRKVTSHLMKRVLRLKLGFESSSLSCSLNAFVSVLALLLHSICLSDSGWFGRNWRWWECTGAAYALEISVFSCCFLKGMGLSGAMQRISSLAFTSVFPCWVIEYFLEKYRFLNKVKFSCKTDPCWFSFQDVFTLLG